MVKHNFAPALVITAVVLCTLGILLIVAWLLTGRTRGYLLYLGIAFLSFAVSQLATGIGAIAVLLLTLLAIFMAFSEAIQDMRTRAAKLRAEEHERETAFAEMMTAVVKKENPAVTAKPATEDEKMKTPSS